MFQDMTGLFVAIVFCGAVGFILGIAFGTAVGMGIVCR